MDNKKPTPTDKDKKRDNQPISDAKPISSDKKRNSLGPDLLWEEIK
jgi:hypothetical protein